MNLLPMSRRLNRESAPMSRRLNGNAPAKPGAILLQDLIPFFCNYTDSDDL